jgi:hypothetical protein
MSNEGQLVGLVEEFLSKIRERPPVKEKEFCCRELRQEYEGHPWPDWTAQPGVYYILGQDRSVLYVGAGTASYGVVYRVEYRVKTKKLPLDTKAKAFLFERSDWYWPWALEAFLIGSLDPPPPLNNRGKRKPNSE